MHVSPLTTLIGNALEQLRALPEGSVQCCVTSIPYWGLRDYSATQEFDTEEEAARWALTTEELPRRCILAGSRRGDVVLDICGGTFTTAIAARMTGRRAIMCEQMPPYAAQGTERYTNATGIFAGV